MPLAVRPPVRFDDVEALADKSPVAPDQRSFEMMSDAKRESTNRDDADKQSSAASPSLGRVLVLTLLWTVVITLHYWACGLSAYVLGDPTDLPRWLKPWNELMNYGISGFLSLLLAMVWWFAAAVLFVPAVLLVMAVDFVFDYIDPPDPVHPVGSALAESFLALVPTMLLTWLSLLILPFDSPRHLDSEAGLAVAEQISYPAFAEYMFLSLFAILTIAVLGFGFCLGVALMMWLSPGGGAWEILPPVFLGIILALLFAFFVGPAVAAMPHQYGVLQATAIFIGGFTLLSAVPTLWLVRSL